MNNIHGTSDMPPKASPRLTIRMPESLHDWLRDYAARHNISMAQIVKDYLQLLQKQDIRATEGVESHRKN